MDSCKEQSMHREVCCM